MSNSIVRAEFETRLKRWADAQTPLIPIAFENAPFTKPTDRPFLEAFLIPNLTLNYTVDGKRKTYMGLFQINCWAPSGKGMGEIERLVQSVINLYPMLPKTGRVSVESTPSAGSSIPDPSGWVIVPVTIKYRMETF